MANYFFFKNMRAHVTGRIFFRVQMKDEETWVLHVG